jgi:hypothetical protein
MTSLIIKFINQLFGLILYLACCYALPAPGASRSEIPSPISTGYDAWAEALSGVGPLILLIGEKNTKQLLREANGLPGILSMSFAPIGLLSVLTSMIRLCGSQKLRSYLGYEHEPRAAAAMEMTKVNCGGIHAEVIDGIVSRSATSNAMSRALAVLFLRGDTEAAVDESLAQIKACHQFQDKKRAQGCPTDSGNVNWCFRVTYSTGLDNTIAAQRASHIIIIALRMSEDASLSSVFPMVNKSRSSLESGTKRPLPSRTAQYSCERPTQEHTPEISANISTRLDQQAPRIHQTVERDDLVEGRESKPIEMDTYYNSTAETQSRTPNSMSRVSGAVSSASTWPAAHRSTQDSLSDPIEEILTDYRA